MEYDLQEATEKLFTAELAKRIAQKAGVPAVTLKTDLYAWPTSGIGVIVQTHEPGKTYPESIASFTLTCLPGDTCDVLVSSGSFVYTQYQGKGIGRLLHRLRLDIAKECKCQRVLATVRTDNKRQLALMESFGWTKLTEYGGQHGSPIGMWVKTL